MFTPLSRREFLTVGLFGAAGALAAGALAACGPRPPELPAKEKTKEELIQNLRDLTGITPDTTQDQLAQLAYDKTFRDPDWYFDPLPDGNPLITPIIQSHFADFTVNGKEIGVGLATDGEPAFIIQTDPREFRPVKYPEITTSELYSNAVFFGNNLMAIYGNREEVDPLVAKWQNDENIRQFIRDFFGEEPSPTPKLYHRNILHLILAPAETGSVEIPTLKDENGALIQFDLGPDGVDARTYVHIPASGGTGTEVIVNLNRTHNTGRLLGLDLGTELASILSNERANMLAAQYALTQNVPLLTAPYTEAFSSLAEILAMLDPQVWKVTLGTDSYPYFFAKLTTLMESLGTETEPTFLPTNLRSRFWGAEVRRMSSSPSPVRPVILETVQFSPPLISAIA